MQPSSYQMATIVAEPYARKKVAKANGLPSGAIPVLASIAFEANSVDIRTPQQVYEAKMGATSLIRSYIATLVRAGFVKRHYSRRDHVTLQLTGSGLLVIGQYQRELREGCMNLGVRATRVVTA